MTSPINNQAFILDPLLFLFVVAVVILLTAYYQSRKSHSTDKSLFADKLNESIKFKRMIEQSPFSILIADAHGNIVFANSKYCEFTGTTIKDLKKLTTADLHPEDANKQVHKEIIDTINAGKIWQGELGYKHREGNFNFSAATIRPIVDEQQKIQNIVFIHQDITDRTAYQEKLFRQANFDSLTGLPNRELTIDRLKRAISIALNSEQTITLLKINLHRFKVINESLGHSYGDKMLVAIADRLKSFAVEGDTLARLTGDEFVIIISRSIAMTNLIFLCEELIEAVTAPVFLSGKEVSVNTSVGLATYPTDGLTAAELLRNADMAVSIAKSSGSNTYNFYKPELIEQSMSKLTMDTELRHALSRNELQLFYQPIVNAETGAPIGLEALIRWNNQSLGFVSPEEFIKLAEENGLIIPIGEWVLREGCRMAALLNDTEFEDMRIAINISPRQIVNGNFVNLVKHALKDSKLNPKYLELEITEGLLMDHSTHTLETMIQLKDLGVNLSLDDFGTGYSSLSYLKRFPFDTLKIDRAFVRDIETDKENAALADAIITMSKAIGLEVIAEGIEDKHQWGIMQRKGCDFMQGYYFGKPATGEAVIDNLKQLRDGASNSTKLA